MDSVAILRSKYPKTYELPIECGFYIPFEWSEIVDRLSAKIEQYLTDHPETEFQVMQVKEKFGGLRFYVNTAIDEIEEYISEAEKEVWELERRRREA